YGPHFLCATFALLAVAWYLTYAPALRQSRTRPRGGDARAIKAVPAAPEACCSSHRATAAGQAGGSRFALHKINRVMLWAATLVILLFALFPDWGGVIFGDAAPAEVPDGEERVVLHIEGMTCVGCAAPLRQALRQVPGVTRVEVNYGRSEAVVTTRLESAVSSDALRRAVEEAGFRATAERK